MSFVATTALLAVFIADEHGELRFVAPALVLVIWVLSVHVLTLLDRDALRRVDFGSPVVTLYVDPA